MCPTHGTGTVTELEYPEPRSEFRESRKYATVQRCRILFQYRLPLDGFEGYKAKKVR